MARNLKEMRCKTCQSWEPSRKKAGRVNLGTKGEPNIVHAGACTAPEISGEFKPEVGTLVFGSLRTHPKFGCVLHTTKR